MSLRIYGNRLLKTLPGKDTRPTTGRVREAIFNIWQEKLLGCHWLDICTGSGAMGAEALVRGAVSVTGIERSPKACQIIQENWRMVASETQQFTLLRGDALLKLKTLTGQQFDLIYFDPPYAGNLYAPVLELIGRSQLLKSTGELAVEHDPKLPLPPIVGLEICRQKIYSNTGLTFYRN
jgi:16S rRNA (guanine966-N2)-methyltransferase